GVLAGYQANAFPVASGNYVPVLYVGTDGKLRGEFYMGSASPITSAAAVNDGAWHHVALVASANTQSLFLDGTLVGTLAGTINHLDMVNNYIGVGQTGGWPAGNGSYFGFTGSIDEVRLWSIARTQTDIQNTRNSVLTGNEFGLVGYWRFE